jgi:hypothetical protein
MIGLASPRTFMVCHSSSGDSGKGVALLDAPAAPRLPVDWHLKRKSRDQPVGAAPDRAAATKAQSNPGALRRGASVMQRFAENTSWRPRRSGAGHLNQSLISIQPG